MREMFTLPWKLPVWTFIDYVVGGVFVSTNHGGPTASYWMIPGTGY
jgi:hypothetical protein